MPIHNVKCQQRDVDFVGCQRFCLAMEGKAAFSEALKESNGLTEANHGDLRWLATSCNKSRLSNAFLPIPWMWCCGLWWPMRPCRLSVKRSWQNSAVSTDPSGATLFWRHRRRENRSPSLAKAAESHRRYCESFGGEGAKPWATLEQHSFEFHMKM